MSEEKVKTTFELMSEKNVNDKVEKKNGLSYLSWAWAWNEVKKVDPNANYEIHENADGNPFFSSPLGIDCKVSVTILGITHTMRLPVMDGTNKAMKETSYTYQVNKYEYVGGKKQIVGKEDKTVEAATAFDVNKTIMRCLVKAIAMHGLGLYIYAGEDLPESEETSPVKAKETNKDESAKPESTSTGRSFRGRRVS